MIVSFQILQPESSDSFEPEAGEIEVESVADLRDHFINVIDAWAAVIVNEEKTGYVGSELYAGDYDYNLLAAEKPMILLGSVNGDDSTETLMAIVEELLTYLS